MLKQFKELITDPDTETLQTDSFEFENEVTNDDDIEIADSGNNQRKVVRMFEPVSKSSADKIMTSIKRQELCIVNFRNVSEEEGNEILNLLSGALYALDGQLIQMSGEIVVCAPKSYMINQENIG